MTIAETVSLFEAFKISAGMFWNVVYDVYTRVGTVSVCGRDIKRRLDFPFELFNARDISFGDDFFLIAGNISNSIYIDGKISCELCLDIINNSAGISNVFVAGCDFPFHKIQKTISSLAIDHSRLVNFCESDFFRGLSHIRLSNICDDDREVYIAIASLLDTVSSVEITYSRFSSYDFSCFVNQMRNVKNIKKLSLYCNELDNDFFENEFLKDLHLLDIGWNGGITQKVLKSHLNKCNNLRYLGLGSMLWYDDAITDLINNILHLPLIALDLSENLIKDISEIDFGDLIYLDLDRNKLIDSIFLKFLPKSLEYFSFFYNNNLSSLGCFDEFVKRSNLRFLIPPHVPPWDAYSNLNFLGENYDITVLNSSHSLKECFMINRF